MSNHQWNDQDKCEKCGDRDWYANEECSVPDNPKLERVESEGIGDNNGFFELTSKQTER